MSLALHLASAVGTDQSSGSSFGPSFLPLMLGGLFAWRGYMSATAIEKATGRRAWGWSPTAWSVLCFFTGLIGRLCLYFAGRKLLATPAWPGPTQPGGAWIPQQPIPASAPPPTGPVWGAPPPPPAAAHAAFSHGPTLAQDILPRP